MTASRPPTAVAPEWLDALHLASPALPIGGFAYSQGLEQAHALGLVHDLRTATVWIRDSLRLVLAVQELPGWLACHGTAARTDWSALVRLAAVQASLRETAELRLESRQMAHSLTRLFDQWLDDRSRPPACVLKALTANFTATHAALCACRGLSAEVGLAAYVWGWLENQVIAAIKLVPLGQAQGQALLHELKPCLQEAVQRAINLPADAVGTAAIGLAIVSSRHETQYTRLFRS